MENLPLVSIITPSYNSADFIEETIQSVLSQSYPRIEHIIIDGESKDDTIDIISKYLDRLIFISERDEGQTDAINKGMNLASGDIIAYLNADDTYLPDTVEIVVNFLLKNPDVMMVYGDYIVMNQEGKSLFTVKPGNFHLEDLITLNSKIGQPAVFLNREAVKIVGNFDEKLEIIMDLDYWIRMGLNFNVGYVPRIIAKFRVHPQSKSKREGFFRVTDEYLYVLDKVYSQPGGIPSSLVKLKKKAYASAFFMGAHDSIQEGRYLSGLHLFFEALNRWPFIIFTTKNIKKILILFKGKFL